MSLRPPQIRLSIELSANAQNSAMHLCYTGNKFRWLKGYTLTKERHGANAWNSLRQNLTDATWISETLYIVKYKLSQDDFTDFRNEPEW